MQVESRLCSENSKMEFINCYFVPLKTEVGSNFDVYLLIITTVIPILLYYYRRLFY